MAVSSAPVFNQLEDHISQLEQIGQFVPGVSGDVRITPTGLIVRDDTGAETIIIDNSGLTINKGKITLNNDGNTLLIDTKGLVSTNNFKSYSTSNLIANLTTSSTTLIDVPNSTLSEITLTRDTNILFMLMGDGYNDAAFTSASSFPYMEVIFHDVVTGDVFTNVVVRGHTTTTAASSTYLSDEVWSRSQIKKIAAGTHQYNLQYRAVPTGNALLFAWTIDIIILGT